MHFINSVGAMAPPVPTPMHKHTQIVASVACRVGSQEFHSWIASLPLVSLLFIVIPTPFLNF